MADGSAVVDRKPSTLWHAERCGLRPADLQAAASELAETAATYATSGLEAMAAPDGRLGDAIRAFAAWICTDVEIAAPVETDFYERWAGCVASMLRFVQEDASYGGPRWTDPEALAMVAAPVLLMRGRQTALGTFLADAVRHIAQHVSDPNVRELPGAGHFAPVIAPESIAKELIRFFESVRQESARQPA